VSSEQRNRLLEILVKRFRFLAKDQAADDFTDRECARRVLLQEFNVEPKLEEVDELLAAVHESLEGIKTSNVRRTIFEGSTAEEDLAHERQTGGGRRIVSKSGPMAG
jgi:hypothetical protein